MLTNSAGLEPLVRSAVGSTVRAALEKMRATRMALPRQRPRPARLPLPLAVALLLAASVGPLSTRAEEEEEPKASFRQRLSLHKPQRLHLSRDSAQSLAAPGLAEDQSGCGCYQVKNSLCCTQALCVCHNVCYNGSALLGNFKRQPCVAVPTPKALPGQKASPLLPIRCRRTEKFRHLLGIALREAPIPDGLGFRYPKWRHTRRAIDWREGTTYLQPLDEPCLNIAHLWGKISQLLLINNASSVAPGLPMKVDRLMFPRHPDVLKELYDAGVGGWHANMLRQLVGLAVKPSLEGAFLRDVPGLKARRFAGKRPLLEGVVEFERAFDAATERQPMCFDRLVLPGTLKAITYPAGAEEANMFREAVREDLRLDAPPVPAGATPHSRAKRAVRLLFINRNASRAGAGEQALTPESEAALLALLKTMNFKVNVLDFEHLSFREQFNQVLNAEIILGLHGAPLINAAMARNRSVLLEIMPYRVFHQGFYFAALNAGLTYFLHQCRQGAPQARDFEFEGTSVKGCLNSPDCKDYFMHKRKVDLPREDLLDLGSLLMQARQVVVEARWNLMWAGRKLKRRFDALCTAKERDVIGEFRWNVKWGGKKLKKRYPEICTEKERDLRCRMDIIRSPYADPHTECIVKKDCEGRALKEEENADTV